MKKKDPFWIIALALAIVLILVDGGLSYLYISGYRAIQEDFNQYKEKIDKLDSAADKKSLPTKNWIEESKAIISRVDSIFKELVGDEKSQKTGKISVLDSSGDIKHYQFFEKLKSINEFKRDVQLMQIQSKDEVVKMATSIKEWLNGMFKKEKGLSNFENWFKKTVLKDGAKKLEELVCEGEEGESESAFIVGSGRYQDIYKQLYSDLTCAISKVISRENLPPEASQKEQEFIREFQRDYNALLPSFLLAKYIVDKVPEFNNVNLKSIYISKWNPVFMSKIISFRRQGTKQQSINTEQVSLCFCYKKVFKGDSSSYAFSCTPDENVKFTVENPNTSAFFFDTALKKESPDNIDVEKLQDLISAMQFTVFPKELGTTFPIAFSFSSTYKNFYELLKALYRLNEKRDGEGGKSIFEELGVEIPVPVIVSRVSFKLNQNISVDYFKFKRDLKDFPKEEPGKAAEELEKAWTNAKLEQEKKLLGDLNKLVNENLNFVIEILVYLYDPQGFLECFKYIPLATKTAEETASAKGQK